MEPGSPLPIHRHPTKDESFVILRGIVSPKHEGEDVEEDNRNWIRNGRVLYLGEKLQYDPFLEYIPFNSITQNDQRAIDFVNDLLQIPEAIQNEQLNVSGLIRGFRKKVKEAYRKAMHKANDNLYSLVVESRPAENVTPTSDARKSHALYFGDFDSKNIMMPYGIAFLHFLIMTQ